jgi:hypothetical protein
MEFPKSTEVNRFIPKEKFYSKTLVDAKLRQLFIDEVEKIRWSNKISPETLNITADAYSELQVFEIVLKKSELSTAILKHIDTFIPYPILFILKKNNAFKAVISFKESTIKSEHKMKVDSYFSTNWLPNFNLEIKGRSVDEIYRNFLFQVEPKLKETSHVNTKAAVESNKESEKLIERLESINKKIASEPSIAKKQVLARERHELEKQLRS